MAWYASVTTKKKGFIETQLPKMNYWDWKCKAQEFGLKSIFDSHVCNDLFKHNF